MNTQTHRLIFNKIRGCMRAVAETASSSSKSAPGTPKAHGRSLECPKVSKNDQFHLSKVRPAQLIRAQAASVLIVLSLTAPGTTATLKAGNNITIEAATNTQTQSSFTEKKESGFLSGGGFGITYGKREQSTDQKAAFTTAAASTVGAITGNININAGQTYKQVGSDLIAPAGDINITARKVDIIEARETSQTTTEQKFKQTALTLSVSSPVVSAIQQKTGSQKTGSHKGRGQVFHYDILLKNVMFRPLRLKPARAPYQVQSNVAI